MVANIITEPRPEDSASIDEGGGNPLTDLADDLFGRSTARIIQRGALTQAELGREAIAAEQEAQARLQETLSPFLGFGADRFGGASRLFGAGAGEAIQGDPAFQAAAERLRVQTLANQAAGGRFSTQETGEMLLGGRAQLGSQFLSSQRGDFLNALRTGQASAAQQAASNLQAGRRSSEILTGIGNALAAGGIGAQQALAQGQSNVGGLVSGITSIFASERKNKRDIKLTGIRPDGRKMYTYRYKWSDTSYIGMMVDENPDLVVDCGNYKAINYGEL